MHAGETMGCSLRPEKPHRTTRQKPLCSVLEAPGNRHYAFLVVPGHGLLVTRLKGCSTGLLGGYEK
jgi:hypothetical protein